MPCMPRKIRLLDYCIASSQCTLVRAAKHDKRVPVVCCGAGLAARIPARAGASDHSRRCIRYRVGVVPEYSERTPATFGMGFSLLTLAVLIALLHFTVRYPFLSTVGQGAGRFAVANDTYAGRKREWALVLTIVALMAVAWTTPDVHWAKVWAAGVSLAVMGCLAAVVWRIRAEQRLRRSVL